MEKTVVLIDDDQDDLDILIDAIEAFNSSIQCTTFTNPLEAMKQLSGELIIIPDFIFTDINMPGMTGDHCIRELRKRKEFDNTIIIVLSTSMPDAFAEKLKRIGADFTFQKPVQLKAYDDMLQQVIAQAN